MGWDAAVTGLGDTRHEAVEDALDMLAQDGWDVSDIRHHSDDSETVRRYLEKDFPDVSERELKDMAHENYFYVCVYVDEAEERRSSRERTRRRRASKRKRHSSRRTCDQCGSSIAPRNQ